MRTGAQEEAEDLVTLVRHLLAQAFNVRNENEARCEGWEGRRWWQRRLQWWQRRLQWWQRWRRIRSHK